MLESFKRMSFKHKNSKMMYYAVNYVRQLLPKNYFQHRLTKKMTTISQFDEHYIQYRVNYYNKLTETRPLSEGATKLSDFRLKKKMKVYFFDVFEFTRYFSSKLSAFFCFGDVTYIPEQPSIVKSRPIEGNNSNSVIMKLDKIRHFLFLHDPNAFQDKKNMLIGRSKINQIHRAHFMEMYFNHPMCDIGGVTKHCRYPQWQRPRLTFDEQMKYKFILCLEGHDVATNLKWVMSSNSLAVMPKPAYETWFMEGKLIPNYHYVQIRDDYSDLEERMNYYIEHTDEALQIIKHVRPGSWHLSE